MSVTMTRTSFAAVAALTLVFFSIASAASGQDRKSIRPRDPANPLPVLISGYYFTPLDIRALQEDDFDNPGFAWVARGEALWSKPEGGAGRSCASCHLSASATMRGKAAAYPKFDAPTGRVVTLEQRINLCRQEKMGASALTYESEELLGAAAYLRLQSRGSVVSVTADGEAKAAFEKGKAIHNGRMGQLGMSCANCHNSHYGQSYRGEIVSQGHSNGFPAYRRQAQKFGSLEARITECFQMMRAEPHAAGSEDYVALQLYLAWRGNGLPVEAPAVRR